MTQDDYTSHPRAWHQSPFTWFILLILVAIIAFVVWLMQPVPPSSVQLVTQAEELLKQGEVKQAEELLQPLVTKTPPDHNAVVVCSRALFQQGRTADCVELLNKLPARDAASSLVSLARASLESPPKLSQSEFLFRAALEANPDDIDAHRELARILGLSARRYEAIPHILFLIRAGKETDLIVLLAHEQSMFGDRSTLEAAQAAAPDDPLPLIGLAGIELAEGHRERSIELLREAIKLNPNLSAPWGRLGSYLVQAEDWDALAIWANDLPKVAFESPETWQALGDIARHGDDTAGAIRCYGEALLKNPESYAMTTHMAELLAQHGEQQLADKLSERAGQIGRFEQLVIQTNSMNQQPSPEQMINLINAYVATGRYWEATAFVTMAANAEVNPNRLTRIIEVLRPEVPNLPLQLTAPKHNPLAGFDLSPFPVPGAPSPDDRGQ
ncbi:MAG: tetratricopeptide repeat protein [Planctomycetaceae bacterium]